MIIVECISIRESMPDQIKVGTKYKLDPATIEGDSDGDWYGTIYDMNVCKIGQLMLKHFKSVESM